MPLLSDRRSMRRSSFVMYSSSGSATHQTQSAISDGNDSSFRTSLSSPPDRREANPAQRALNTALIASTGSPRTLQEFSIEPAFAARIWLTSCAKQASTRRGEGDLRRIRNVGRRFERTCRRRHGAPIILSAGANRSAGELTTTSIRDGDRTSVDEDGDERCPHHMTRGQLSRGRAGSPENGLHPEQGSFGPNGCSGQRRFRPLRRMFEMILSGPTRPTVQNENLPSDPGPRHGPNGIPSPAPPGLCPLALERPREASRSCDAS